MFQNLLTNVTYIINYYHYVSELIIYSLSNYYVSYAIYHNINRKYQLFKNKIARRLRAAKRLKKNRTHWATRKKYAKMLHENHNIPQDICDEIFYHYIY